MSQTPIEPDEAALADWEKLPKGKPSRQALPPATGGMPNWLWILVLVILIVAVVGWLAQ